jgi:hypothetical protein
MSGTLPFSSPARFAKANNYWHYQPRIRAGFCTLETPDRCLKDRVHLIVYLPFVKRCVPRFLENFSDYGTFPLMLS